MRGLLPDMTVGSALSCSNEGQASTSNYVYKSATLETRCQNIIRQNRQIANYVAIHSATLNVSEKKNKCHLYSIFHRSTILAGLQAPYESCQSCQISYFLLVSSSGLRMHYSVSWIPARESVYMIKLSCKQGLCSHTCSLRPLHVSSAKEQQHMCYLSEIVSMPG